MSASARARRPSSAATSTNFWTTPGGTFKDTQVAASQTMTGTGQKFFDVTALTQCWVDGTRANNGLVMKATSEPGGKDFTFPANGAAGSPYLEINYQARFGNRRGATQNTTPLTDRSSLSVNVANGNLVVQATDLSVAGTGPSNSVQRTYNSLDPNLGPYGTGWLQAGRYPYIFGATGDSMYYSPLTVRPTSSASTAAVRRAMTPRRESTPRCAAPS